MARPVDGAVALVIASEHVARQVTNRPVWITGMGSAIDQHFLAARDATSFPAAAAAAANAFRMSGVTSARDFDVVEVSAGSTVGELMVLEAIGLAEPGRAMDLYSPGAAPGLNASGGSLPADVVMATGLVRMHEVASQLAGRSAHGPTGATTGLAHGAGGIGMQNHCVVTLETS
jgi:acetyl-CoA C-acetyltransferase